MTFKEISDAHFVWLVEKNWVGRTTPLEQLMLIVSEAGEAANECRGAEINPALGSELADIVLRTMGMAKGLNIDLEAEILAKMKVNRERADRGRIK